MRKSKSKLTADVVGHVPREISRIMYYFLNRGGKISAVVNSGRYRPSPIPKGELEILVSVTLKIDNENRRYLQRLIQLINDNYDPAVPVENNKSANDEEASDEMAKGTGNEEIYSLLATKIRIMNKI